MRREGRWMPSLSRLGAARVSGPPSGWVPLTVPCFQPRAVALLAAALTLAAALVLPTAGCGTGGSISDSKIAAALDLKQAAHGYEMGGDPFCAVDELLND